MAELVYVDPTNFEIERFDMDPKSVKPQSFKDEKTGKDQTYFTGELLYCDPADGVFKPPFFLAEGDSFGIGKADGNKKEDGKAPAAVPQFVQLPSALGPNSAAPGGERKEKWQVAVKLSELPAEKDWKPTEVALINFIDSQLRRILAHVLVKRIDILTTIGSNAINDAREKLMAELKTPQGAAYQTQELQLARLRVLVEEVLYGKISHKVYRKKKAPPTGQASGGMSVNLLDASGSYDETKHPCLYAGCMNFIGKQSKKEEFITTYYKFVEGVAEDEWPKLTHQEAVALGWYRVRVACRYDNVYFGASIAPQIKAAEIVMLKAIAGGMGHKGRLIKADPSVPRDKRLISRTPIQPAGGVANNNHVQPEQTGPVGQMPPQIQAPATPMNFDPTALGIPGVGVLPQPQIQ